MFLTQPSLAVHKTTSVNFPLSHISGRLMNLPALTSYERLTCNTMCTISSISVARNALGISTTTTLCYLAVSMHVVIRIVTRDNVGNAKSILFYIPCCFLLYTQHHALMENYHFYFKISRGSSDADFSSSVIWYG